MTVIEPPNRTALRGATEGPLASLTPVFVDVETFVDSKINLGCGTLRQYLAQTYLTAIAIAIEEDEPIVLDTPGGTFDDNTLEALEGLKALAKDPNYVFVAHNAAFDIRVLRFLLDVPQPQNVWCTMEGSMGAWPELPGGYGLDNVGRKLAMPKKRRKMKLDLLNLGKARAIAERSPRGSCPVDDMPDGLYEQLVEIYKDVGEQMPVGVFSAVDFDYVLNVYNKRDVETMQEIYYQQAARIPAQEQRIALMTHRVRRNHFVVNGENLDSLIFDLGEAIQEAEDTALDYVTDDADIRQIFNRDNTDGAMTSIRYTRLRGIVQNKMGAAELDTTSLKKASPVVLARHPNVHGLLEQTARAGKMVFHRRRAEQFRNVDVVDAELGYMRAHTGRFSSPSQGKGLNLHNIPKHDKAVAKPVRKLYQLPEGKVAVRADLANVEYRIEGKLTTCETVTRMFEPSLNGDPLADPYSGAWKSMTGIDIDRSTPEGKATRQVAKSAVLGLGFQMSAAGYAIVLLKEIAAKRCSIGQLRDIALALGWQEPRGGGVDRVVAKVGCDRMVALASYHIHRSFQQAHPEFNMVAEWLVTCVNSVAACGWIDGGEQAQHMLEHFRNSPRAPDPSMLELNIDFTDTTSNTAPSIRVTCGPWDATVCWREPKMRALKFGDDERGEHRLTIRKSTGQFKTFTRQLAIENVTQACARNMLCEGLLQLEPEYPDILHVHDEVLLIVDNERRAVLKAREDLLDTFGPGASRPLGWATLVKPEEISVTQSMYEDEDDIDPRIGDRWGKIERNEPGCLLNLP